MQKGIELEVASNRSIRSRMEIGAVTESVQVTANAAMVETEDSAISQVISQSVHRRTAAEWCNPTQLLTLNAAVISNADAAWTTPR